MIAVTMVSVSCCYQLGVNDGYMYSKEPWNPGYKKAEKILIKYGKLTNPSRKEDEDER